MSFCASGTDNCLYARSLQLAISSLQKKSIPFRWCHLVNVHDAHIQYDLLNWGLVPGEVPSPQLQVSSATVLIARHDVPHSRNQLVHEV